MIKIAVFVSGRGSNFVALYESLKNERDKAKIDLLVANRPCQAIEKAKEFGIPVFLVSLKPKENFLSFEELKNLLIEREIKLIVLAGFLKKIPHFFVRAFENRIINIHPALLPAYGGKGMYGMNVHKAVFDAGEKYSGVTVHLVDEYYDNGKILAQRKVDISGLKSPEEIAEKVLKLEHELLPEVVRKIVTGEMDLDTIGVV